MEMRYAVLSAIKQDMLQEHAARNRQRAEEHVVFARKITMKIKIVSSEKRRAMKRTKPIKYLF